MFSDAGHFLHDDMPATTVDALIDLWRWNDREAIKRVCVVESTQSAAKCIIVTSLESRVTGKL